MRKKSDTEICIALVHRSILTPNFLFTQLAKIEEIKYLEF